jgi:hypothetical protein
MRTCFLSATLLLCFLSVLVYGKTSSTKRYKSGKTATVNKTKSAVKKNTVSRAAAKKSTTVTSDTGPQTRSTRSLYGTASRSAVLNEDDLFSDTSSVVKSSEIVNTVMKKKRRPKNTFFNGTINGAVAGNANRHWYSEPDSVNVQLTNYIVGNFMLDIRLPGSNKGYVNVELPYNPSINYSTWANTSTLFQLREFFIDGNMNKRVYLRLGKQVLQWGRCKLWNPTDLINVEKKLFIPKIGYREGTYGLKMHVPFGTVSNLYGFLDTKSLTSGDSLAAALKFEFVVKSTEMAFSLWAKPNNNMVAGYDISTRILGFDIVGELSMAGAANSYSLALNLDSMGVDTLLTMEKPKGLQTKFCIDVGRKFNFLSFPDNLSITFSFYMNSVGYEENLFADTVRYKLKEPLFLYKPPQWEQINDQTKTDFLIMNNLYEQHNFSKYYLALFTQVDRLVNSGLTGIFNVVANIPQSSFIYSAGLTYTSLHEFFGGIFVSAYIGKKNTEYTFQNHALGVQMNVGMTFY